VGGISTAIFLRLGQSGSDSMRLLSCESSGSSRSIFLRLLQITSVTVLLVSRHIEILLLFASHCSCQLHRAPDPKNQGTLHGKYFCMYGMEYSVAQKRSPPCISLNNRLPLLRYVGPPSKLKLQKDKSELKALEKERSVVNRRE